MPARRLGRWGEWGAPERAASYETPPSEPPPSEPPPPGYVWYLFPGPPFQPDVPEWKAIPIEIARELTNLEDEYQQFSDNFDHYYQAYSRGASLSPPDIMKEARSHAVLDAYWYLFNTIVVIGLWGIFIWLSIFRPWPLALAVGLIALFLSTVGLPKGTLYGSLLIFVWLSSFGLPLVLAIAVGLVVWVLITMVLPRSLKLLRR